MESIYRVNTFRSEQDTILTTPSAVGILQDITSAERMKHKKENSNNRNDAAIGTKTSISFLEFQS